MSDRNPYLAIEYMGWNSWKRPGKARAGHRYDTQKAIKEQLGFHIRNLHKKQEPMTGPLAFLAVFYKKRPMSHRKMDDPPIFCDVKPDVDNLCKFVLDCLNSNELIVDDAKFVWLHAEHLWGPSDYTAYIIGPRTIDMPFYYDVPPNAIGIGDTVWNYSKMRFEKA